MNTGEIRRVLVVGASSYLGNALAQGLRDSYQVFGTYHAHPMRLDGVTCYPLNLHNGGEILDLLKRVRPDAVLYTAGLFDLDACAKNKAEAETVNLKAAAVFYRLPPIPTRFVYYSSDEVFGMLDSPPAKGFTELTMPTPSHVYGRTRSQGESAALSAGKGTVVLRTGRIYGENFRVGGHLAAPPLAGPLEKLALGQTVPFAQDVIRSPVYIGDVVRATALVLSKLTLASPSKLYNLGSPDAVSDYDFALAYARAFSIDAAQVQPGSLAGDARQGRAVRAPLDSTRFTSEMSFPIPSLRDGLSEFAARVRKGNTSDWSL